MAKGNELIRGYGNSKGNRSPVICKLRILKDDPEAPGANPVTSKLMETKPGECIVAVKTVPDQNKYLELAAAIIQNSGGKASHGNSFCLARNKPSIYNTQGVVQVSGSTNELATEVLKDGQMVVVEGYTETVEEKQADGSVKRREYGVVYDYIPEAGAPPMPTPGAKPTLAELMAKYGMKAR